MKLKKTQIDKQKLALLGLLIAVGIGGFLFFQSSPDAEATVTPVETPVVAETQAPPPEVLPAAPVETPAEQPSLGASSSGLGR